jgi:hypothetical protein
VPGFTGTTSWCAIRITGGREASVPVHVISMAWVRTFSIVIFAKTVG